ncbi:MAG: hypothetical protein IJS03_00205 [Eubacterium sp.]|nr:hypothetical protein [Eubacterium sp.]
MDYIYDVAIITAVEIEEESVKRLYDSWKEIKYPDDNQLYYEAAFVKDSVTRRVITARQKEMGMTAASHLASKIINKFRPRYLIMTGISAGIGAEQIYGDVIVPDVIWNYAAGKFVSASSADITFGDIGFLPRPIAIEIDSEILKIIKRLKDSPDNEFHLHIGPMACGNSVVANRDVVNKQIHSLFPQTVGLDMESYSVFYAAKNSTEPKPKAIVIKSICDYADAQKSDKYQKFAAYTSSQFAKYLYEKHLPY